MSNAAQSYNGKQAGVAPMPADDKRKAVRAATNPADASTLSVNERILKKVHEIYTKSESGALKEIADSVDIQPTILPPRKRVSVLIIGNHSAGKSSFINWYCGENIQKTGVAIETAGVTVIHSGKKRETWRGEASLNYFSHLQPLRNFPNLVQNVATEISESKEKMFGLVDFIDTPGLVDGNLSYAFDVDEVILWLAGVADLIFVFFDPIGKSLTSRTMNIVERLNSEEKLRDKIKYYMTKADTVPDAGDRQKVLIQITQNLTSRVRNAHAFDLPTIYIPQKDEHGQERKSAVTNKLHEVVEAIESTVNLSVQSSLNTLKRDCERVLESIKEIEARDARQNSANLWAHLKGALLRGVALALPALLLLHFLMLNFRDSFAGLKGTRAESLFAVHDFVRSRDVAVQQYIAGALGVGFLILYGISWWTWRVKPTLSKKELAALRQKRTTVQGILKTQSELYKLYFKQSVQQEYE